MLPEASAMGNGLNCSLGTMGTKLGLELKSPEACYGFQNYR